MICKSSTADVHGTDLWLTLCVAMRMDRITGSLIPSRICLQRMAQCLYWPFEYNTLISSMAVDHSVGVNGKIVKWVTEPERAFLTGAGAAAFGNS